jgi:hypothetical protein
MELLAWGLRDPYGMAFGEDGNLYVSDNDFEEMGDRAVAEDPDRIWRARSWSRRAATRPGSTTSTRPSAASARDRGGWAGRPPPWSPRAAGRSGTPRAWLAGARGGSWRKVRELPLTNLDAISGFAAPSSSAWPPATPWSPASSSPS